MNQIKKYIKQLNDEIGIIDSFVILFFVSPLVIYFFLKSIIIKDRYVDKNPEV